MNESIIIILLGATGDLSKRRLLPALYSLLKHKHLPSSWLLCGVGREAITTPDILKTALPFVEEFDEATWQEFCSHFVYQKTDFANADDVEHLARFLETEKKKLATDVVNTLVYMALPSQFFAPVTQTLGQHTVIYKKQNDQKRGWCRVVYEKPFGQDRASAGQINKVISQYLDESQIYRVDHYLAKDIIGTLALVRFTNRVFEPLWNYENIDWVEIALRETVSVEGRGLYYDAYGALKDVVQNHLMQILALLSMEAPRLLSGDAVRDQVAAVLQKIYPVDGILGQYDGYFAEKGVAQGSKTETFAALKFMIDTPRWQQVPFYITTGKCMNTKDTVITVQFKHVKCLLSSSCPSQANKLTIRVLPKPLFSLELNVKKPGLLIEVMPVTMDFCYECTFGSVKGNTYELVLQEVLIGEQSISVRFDEIEFAWDVIEKIKALHLPLYSYQKGSRGPKELEEFADKHHMRWQS
jgi:glucose-6-phosphate 1-dehydrogenase